MLSLLAWVPLLACVSDGSELRQAASAEAAARPADFAPTEVGSGASLEVRFLDVGQGDAVMLRSWTEADGERRPGQVALIDAGPVNRVVAQLRTLGVDQIDLLVASHNHLDHIGGMDAILDSIPVRFYLDNGHPANTRIQRRVLERVESRGVTYLQPTRRTISIGSANLDIVPAPTEAATGDDQNNRSLTVVVRQGSFRALLTGDAEVPLINALLQAGDIPEGVDVFKASHHGSRNGVTPGLLTRARPRFVVIGVGADNTYGHPHASALRYLCAGGRTVLRTDLHGDVTFDVDPDGAAQARVERGTVSDSTVEPPSCAVRTSATLAR